ncbi:MAG: GDP-mannose 4,6-dehydratase, partial [Candidatus Nanopelagicales bacterium]
MAKTALVTGIAGQDGVLLARQLLGRGYQVVGVTRGDSASLMNAETYLSGVEVVTADICDGDAMGALIERVGPDEIYNLAGFSSVGASWNHPDQVTEVNALAVVKMLEQIRAYRDRSGREPRFYQASSSEMFGLAAEQPQNVNTPHHPRSPYAASKSFAHYITMNFRE